MKDPSSQSHVFQRKHATMNLLSSSQGRDLGQKRPFHHSPTPLSSQSSPLSSLSSLSASSTSPGTSDGEVSATNIDSISVQSVKDNNHKNQDFHGKVEADPYQGQHFSEWTNESSIPPLMTSLYNSVLNSHPENFLNSDPQPSAEAFSSDSSQIYSFESPDSAENLPVQIKSGCLVCCWKTCGKKFPNLKELAVHVNDVHVRIECPDVDFQCQWQGCSRQGRGFNARYKMLIHIRTHTNEKPHTCVVCNKTFSRLENLKIHTRSHTGEKPYRCSFLGCGKAYSNSSDRFKHVRTHQEEKPYKCKMPGCRKQYTDPSSLRKHVRTHGHFGSTVDIWHHSLKIEVPNEEDNLKNEENYSVKRHFDAQTDFNNERFCELSNKSSSDHLSKKKRCNEHYNLDVRCDSANSVGENKIFLRGLADCENSIETVCKIDLAEDKVNSLDWFGAADEKVSNLDRLRFAADRLKNTDRLIFAEDKLNNSERFKLAEYRLDNSERFKLAEDRLDNSERFRHGNERFNIIDRLRFAEDKNNSQGLRVAEERINNLNRFTESAETQKLFWKKQNINSEVLNNDIQELCSVKTDKGNYSCVQNVPNSEKLNSIFGCCNEQSESKAFTKQQNKQDNVIPNESKVFKHSNNSISGFSHKLENAYSSSAQNCSEKMLFHLPNDMDSECDKNTKCLSSSPTFVLSNKSPKTSSKTSHIEHWKKRKIMNREKELQTLHHSPSHLSQSAQAVRSHSTPASESSQSCSENPQTSSVSVLSNIPPTTSTPFTDIHSPLPPSHLSPIPHPPTAINTNYMLAPQLSQHIQQSLPSVHLSPTFQAVNPSLYLTHHNSMYPLLSNSYSFIQSSHDTRTSPSFYMPGHSSLTLSECSVIPLLTAHHLNSRTDPSPDHYPTYLLPPGTSSPHFKFQQLPGTKEMLEHVNPNYLQYIQDIEDAYVLSAANLGQFGFSYPDFSLNHSPFHQSCRTLFPLRLGDQR